MIHCEITSQVVKFGDIEIGLSPPILEAKNPPSESNLNTLRTHESAGPKCKILEKRRKIVLKQTQFLVIDCATERT